MGLAAGGTWVRQAPSHRESGCSYAGKMALWAGAFDERIALTIPEESGGGREASRVPDAAGTKPIRCDDFAFKFAMLQKRVAHFSMGRH
jgi:hypothetical protein